MDIIIRTATEKDYSELSRLYDELNKMHVKALPHLFVKPSKTPQDLAYIRGIMKNKDAVLFIAQSGEETIGFIEASVRQPPDHPEAVKNSYAYIDDICVKNDYRRSSIGEKLMEAVEKWAIDLGLSQIELNVWDFNKSAMAFFADTGYKPLNHIMEKNLNKRLVKSVPRASRK
jgi:ribosomal protein S18 acetylase RimI-like enzyme